MKKLKEAKTNIIIGAIAVLFSIAYFICTFSFKIIAQPNSVNATFFPRILAGFMAAMSVLVFFRGVSEYRKIPVEERRLNHEEKAKERASAIRLLIVIGDLLLAAALLEKLGFMLTMPWTMFILFVTLEKPEKRKYGLYALLSIVLPIAMFFIFYYVFSSLLPMGVLKKFLSMYVL